MSAQENVIELTPELERERYSAENEYLDFGWGFINGVPYPGIWMTYKAFKYFDDLDQIVVPKLKEIATQAWAAQYEAEQNEKKTKERTLLYVVGSFVAGVVTTGVVVIFGGN